MMNKIDKALCAQVHARDLVTWAELATDVNVMAATRGLLWQPEKPLRPYSGILPHATAVLRTRAESLLEVTLQASHVREHPHLIIDHAAFEAAATWEPRHTCHVPHIDLLLPLLLRRYGEGRTSRTQSHWRTCIGACKYMTRWIQRSYKTPCDVGVRQPHPLTTWLPCSPMLHRGAWSQVASESAFSVGRAPRACSTRSPSTACTRGRIPHTFSEHIARCPPARQYAARKHRGPNLLSAPQWSSQACSPRTCSRTGRNLLLP